MRSQLESIRNFDVKFALGFVKQAKRLNVAITRAKAALIVIGNAKVLETDSHWKALLDHAVANNAMVGDYPPKHDGGGGGGGSSSSSSIGGGGAGGVDDLAELAAMAATLHIELEATSAAVSSPTSDGNEDEWVAVPSGEACPSEAV